MSFRDEDLERFQVANAAEPATQLHAALDWSDTVHLDSGDMERILASPLLREVRVLDLSFDRASCDHEEALLGRGLRLEDVLENVRSDRLEVLDLTGQRTDDDRRIDVERHLPRLRALGLGGGHPVSQPCLAWVAEHCPNLEALGAHEGQCVDAFPSEREEGVAGWEALGRLPALRRVEVDDALDPALAVSRVTETLFEQRDPRVASWDAAFDR